ncbi:MAG: TPM domain-containing protein [Arenimonas sp.]
MIHSFSQPLRLHALCVALALALVSCSAPDNSGSAAPVAPAPAQAAASSMTETQMVNEVAASLQACSYDGSPVKVNVSSLGDKVPTECRDMVAQIMKFTGLPQNFDVVEADVPNAAALIVIGDDKLPHRVIAFNNGFMDDVRHATGNNNWAPVSIMAHEIGHHLSGHTITPGGSQPPIELEADKFSGFVLYKMGAQLADAEKALVTLVPEADGPTHPGRGKRVAAIEDGWKQACQQQGGECSGGNATATAPSAAANVGASAVPGGSAPPRSANAGGQAQASAPAIAAAIAAGTRDRLPLPSAQATPSKFNQFIYDEFGLLDPTIRAGFEKQMYDHAKQWQVEIVTLLVRDLHGLSGDAYAQAMLRQLRVGKLDVGNGVVLVIAPEQNQVGIAMGPGVALEMEFQDKKRSLQSWLDTGYPNCKRQGGCKSWTENFMQAADHIRRDTDNLEWTIRYADLGALMAANASAIAARSAGSGFDPKADPVRKIARVHGTVVNLSPALGDKSAWVLETIVSRGKKAVHVKTADGHTLMFYLDPATEALMPAGKLLQGRRYAFTARVKSLSANIKDTQAFDLLSYDEVN